MALITGASLGTTTLVQYVTREIKKKILDERYTSQKNKLRTVKDTGYSSKRGIMAEKGFELNPERCLIFQFNPETISDSKDNNFVTKPNTGFQHVDYVWGNGGERTITFNLHFEATAAVNSPHFNKGRNTSDEYFWSQVDTLDKNFPNGTLDDVEVLRSYQYPKKETPVSPRFSNGGFIPSPKFMPPPVVIFSYGPYYLEGYVTAVNFSHELFNKDLVPIRTKAEVTFKVLESIVVPVVPLAESKHQVPNFTR
jgi:hypothetical protein